MTGKKWQPFKRNKRDFKSIHSEDTLHNKSTNSQLSKLLNYSEPDKEEDLPEKSNIDTTDSTWNVKNQKNNVNLERNQLQSKLIWETVSLCHKWLEILLVSTTVKSSTLLKSNSIWLVDIWVNSHYHINQQDMVRLVSVPLKVLLIPHLNDFCYYLTLILLLLIDFFVVFVIFFL